MYYSAYLFGIILGCVIFGSFLGLIPLIIGIRRDEKGLGAAGMIFTIIGTMICLGWGFCVMGILFLASLCPVVPVCFTIAIFIKSR